jgi:hypothetical protein
MKTMILPMNGFLNEDTFNKLLNDITIFSTHEYTHDIDSLLHPSMLEIMDSCDSSDKDIFQKGVVSVLNKTFPNLIGGAYVEVLSLDDELPEPRRLLFKVFLEGPKKWVVIKITRLTENYNIRTIDDIIDNCFKWYNKNNCDIDNKDTYLNESLIYKLTNDFLNRDTYLLTENYNEPLFLKFYEIIPVNARRSSVIEIAEEPFNVPEIYKLNTTTLLCSVIESAPANFIEYQNYLGRYRPDYWSQYAIIKRLSSMILYAFNEYNFVHWDLHDKNFMIDPHTKSLKIYDFDWSTFGNIRSDNLYRTEYMCSMALKILMGFCNYPIQDVVDILGHARDIGLLHLSIGLIPDIEQSIYNNIHTSRTNSWLFEIVYGLNLLDPRTKNYDIRNEILNNIYKSGNNNYNIESYYHGNTRMGGYRNFRIYI